MLLYIKKKTTYGSLFYWESPDDLASREHGFFTVLAIDQILHRSAKNERLLRIKVDFVKRILGRRAPNNATILRINERVNSIRAENGFVVATRLENDVDRNLVLNRCIDVCICIKALLLCNIRL